MPRNIALDTAHVRQQYVQEGHSVLTLKNTDWRCWEMIGPDNDPPYLMIKGSSGLKNGQAQNLSS